ncbi:MAG TPA: sensor histidine kinase, partial [Limnochordia bacterium]|nr:sensor histidine kinase [Limnochordia bacterium]
ERSRLVRERRAVADLEARHRLARDLHDAVSQSLFSLVMNVRAVRERLERGQPEAALAALRPIEALARGALSEMRALIFGLRRAELGDAGLAETLTRYARAQPLLADVAQTFAIEVEPVGELGEAIFRIVQEGLNNVIKHAAARRVEVSVRAAEGLVRVEVLDDGRGFAPEATPEGYGRRSLAERCRALGGRMGIESAPSRGARLWAELPFPQGTGAPDAAVPEEDER